MKNNPDNSIPETTTDFIHITDTHLLDDAEHTFHGLDTRTSLELVLSRSLLRYPDVDFILFTGDISQTGNKPSYEIFRSLIQQYNVPVYCVPGNHDSPECLRSIIRHSPDNDTGFIEYDAFTLVLLNSCIPDKHHGRLNQMCLKQLDQYLLDYQSGIIVFALHHPPMSVNSKWLDDLGLQNSDELLHLFDRHPGNKLVLSGHVHQEHDYCRDGLRILTTPSTCHQFQTNSDHMNRTYSPPPAYRHVSISAAGDIDTSVHFLEEDWHQYNINIGTRKIA